MTSSNPITGKKTGVHKTTTGFVKKTVLTFLIKTMLYPRCSVIKEINAITLEQGAMTDNLL